MVISFYTCFLSLCSKTCCKCTKILVNNRYPPLKYVNETHLFAGVVMKHFDKVPL